MNKYNLSDVDVLKVGHHGSRTSSSKDFINEVGKEVRNSIKRLGGTMPENLQTPEKSLKELEKSKKLDENML